MERDERDAQMILTCLRKYTPNMWHADQPISNNATGKIATEAMCKNTLSIKERGHQAMSGFIVRFTLPEDTTTGKSYYAPIKKKTVNLFKEGNTTKKRYILDDEGQSFADVLSIFDNKSLDLRKITEWLVTSKPCSICREENKSRRNQKSLFRNHLELLSPIPTTTTLKVSTFQL